MNIQRIARVSTFFAVVLLWVGLAWLATAATAQPRGDAAGSPTDAAEAPSTPMGGADASGAAEPVVYPRGTVLPVYKTDATGEIFTCAEVIDAQGKGKFEGLCGTYKEDGTPKTEKTYVNGKEHGPHKLFYEDGVTVKSSCAYISGKPVGDQYNYAADGKTMVAHFVFDANGLKHGSQYDYHLNGVPSVIEAYDHGTHLWTKVYDEKGKLIEEWSTP